MKVFRSLFQITALFFLALSAAPGPVRAGELPEFYRGVRAMGMGNAFTAIADDADALFYNPAGLSLNARYDFRLLNPKIDISTDDIAIVSDIRAAASKIDGPTLSALFGKHLYADISALPMILFPGFAIGYYYNVQTHIVSRNLSLPAIDASYIRDHGLVGGFSREFRGFAKHHFLRVGVGGKWLTRQGFHQVIPITSLVTADKTYLAQLNSATATGYGATIGMQYEVPINRSNDLILGSAWQDVGDTTFGNDLQNNRPPPIRNNLSVGGAFVHRFNPSFRALNNVKLTAEMRHLAEPNKDPRLRMHAGVELKISDLSIQGGFNQDSLCLGMKLDLVFLEVAAVTYGIENQSLAFMDRERRYMLQATMKFDIMGRGLRPERDEDRRKHPRQY